MRMSIIKFEPNQCRKTREHLDYYLSNEMMVDPSPEVMKHLETCESCSNEFESRRRMKNMLKKAVQKETASVDLQSRIQQSIRQPARHQSRGWIAAIAAMAVIAVGLWGALKIWNSRAITNTSPLADFTNSSILKTGLGNHVHCAIDSGFENRVFTDEETKAKLGDRFYGLVSVVEEKLPEARVVVGHHCRFEGRAFLHLILKKDEATVSVALTEKAGESFSPKDALDVVRASGIEIHRDRIDDFEVAGFETRDHLAFVVSALQRESNSLFAARLAPAVQRHLAAIES
jgi:hypothetical protein